MDMAYCGSAYTTVFNRISIPPLEMKFSFHPSSFALTWPNIQANMSFLVTPGQKVYPNISLSFQLQVLSILQPNFVLK